jgi:hypothetical protein
MMNLQIPSEHYEKIMRWMKKKPLEVSGFGDLEYDAKTKTFTVTDVYLLKQTVSSASTEIDDSHIGTIMYERRDNPLAMKWHWHSHVNMGVFWSADDRALIKDMAEQGWILASVFNLKGEMKTAFSMYPEFEGHKMEFFKDDIPTELVTFYPQDVLAQWDKEYDDMVSERKYIAPVSDYKTYDYGYGYQQSIWPKQKSYDYGNKSYAYNKGNSIDSESWEWRDDEYVHKSKLTPKDYEVDGFSKTPGYIYNPLRDKTLTTLKEYIQGFGDLDEEDLTILLDADRSAEEFYNRYEKEITNVRISNEATGHYPPVSSR